MNQAKDGKSVEVTRVTAEGFGLLLPEGEVFLAFEHFPWFRDVTIDELKDVWLLSPQHLYWPDLDVDIHVDSIHHPERFPLIMQPERKAPDTPGGGKH